MALSPQLSATPGNPTTYSVAMAETFSWVPVNGADRPLFAQAVYIVNDAASTPSTSTTAATFGQIVKTVAATATPEAISPTALLVDSVEILAQKNRTTSNTGNVFIGSSSVNDSQQRVIQPGNSMTLTAPVGKKIDLAQIYVDVATNGDGVIASYVA